MRKELVYSLMAVGAFPVAVNAANVNATVATPDVKGGWTHDTDATDDVVTIASGETSATVSLLPGSYTLKLTTLTGSAATTVTVTGIKETGDAAKKTTAANGGVATLPFTVEGTGETNVTITINGDGQYEFNGVELNLVFDFAEKVTLLKTNYGIMAATLQSYTYEGASDDLTGYAKSILEKIEAIEKAGEEDGYSIYKANKLYQTNPTALSQIQSDIDQAAADTKAKEIDFKAKNLQKDYDAQKAIFDKLSAAAQAQVNGKDADLDKDGKVTMTAVQDAITAFKNGSSVDDATVKASLTTLTNKVAKASGADTANTTAYNDIKKAIQVATSLYTEQVDLLYADLSGDNFKQIREEAATKIQEQFNKITAYTTQAETANTNGKCVDLKTTLGIGATGDAIKDKATIGTALSGIITEIETIATNYKNAGTTVANALKEAADLQTSLDNTKADKATAAAIEADANVKADADAAQALIDRLVKKLTNPTYEEVITDGVIADALASKEYGTAVIAAAIEKLNTGDNRKNYNAHIDNAALIAAQVAAVQAGIDEVAAYCANAKDDKTLPGLALATSDYNPATYWAKTITYLKKAIADAQTAEQKSYTEGKAASYSLDAYNTSKTELAKYITEAKAAAAKWAEVKAAADKYAADLATATNKVKNLDIYKDGQYNVGEIAAGTSYEKFIASIQAKLDKLISTKVDNKVIVGCLPRATGTVSSSDTKYSDEHYATVMSDVKDDPTIATDIQKILNNYEADQANWAEMNMAQAIATLNNAIDELQNELNTKIAELKTDAATKYGPGAEDVTKALDAIKVPTDDEQTTANAAEKPVAELNKLVTELNAAKTALKEAEDGVIKTATDNVAAYKAAQTAKNKVQETYDKTISTEATQADKSAWKVDYNGLKYTGQTVTDAVTAVLKQFNETQDSINNLFANAKSAINTAYNKQQLKADVYAADIAYLNAQITAAKTAADAVQANWAAKNTLDTDLADLLTLLDTKIAEANTAVDAVKDFSDADKAEAKTYVSKTGVLGKKYAAEQADIVADAAKAYLANDAVSQKSVLDKQIAALKAKINSIKDDLLKIIDAKKEQDAQYTKTNTYWNTVYTKLSTMDQTTQLTVRQEAMAGFKEQLVEQKAKIASDYSKGESVDNGVVKALEDIYAEIEKIDIAVSDLDAQNKQILTDNVDRMSAFNDALKAAQDAYTHAAEAIYEFSILDSDVLDDLLTAANIDVETLSAQLEAYPAQLKKLKEDAQADYDKVKAANDALADGATASLFDKDGKWVADAEALEANIAAFEQDFLDKITASINDAVTAEINAYNAAIDDAKGAAYIKTTADGKDVSDNETALKNLKTRLFADAAGMVADIEVAFEDVDLEALADALDAAADEETGVAAAIEEAKNTAADYTLQVLIKDIEAKKAVLADGEAAAVKTAIADVQTAYTIADKDAPKTIDALLALYNTQLGKLTVAANFNAWETAFESLSGQIKAAADNDTNYKNLTTAIELANKAIASAKAEAEKYVAVKTATDALDDIAADIAQIEDALEATKEAGAAKTASEVATEVKAQLAYKSATDYTGTIKDNIATAIHKTLYDAQYALLKGDKLTQLNDQYVLYAANFDNEAQTAAYKKQIDDWKKLLTGTKAGKTIGTYNGIDNTIADGNAKADANKGENKFITDNWNASKLNATAYEALLKDLLTVQNDMAALLTEMAAGTKDQPLTSAAALTELTEAISELETAASLPDTDEDVKKMSDVAEAQAEVQAEIASLKALVEKNADNILLYYDEYNDLIEDAQVSVAALELVAETAQATLDARIEAMKNKYEALINPLKDAQLVIEAQKKEIDGYKYTTSSAYKAKYTPTEQSIETELGVLDGKYAKIREQAVKTAESIFTADDQAAVDALATAKYDEKGVFEELTGGSVLTALNSIANTAAKRELKGELDQLKVDYAAITYVEDNYLLDDLKKIEDDKAAIATAIAKMATTTKSPAYTCLFDKVAIDKFYTNLQGSDKFDASKDFDFTADDILLQDGIDRVNYLIKTLNKYIADNSLVQPEPVSPDFNGDGEVGVDDYEALVNEVLAATNAAEFDLNQDGVVDLQDIVAWVDAYNKDGVAEAAARAINSMDDTALMEVVSTNNGVTRLAINLNSADNYRGLQVDVKGLVSAVSATDRAEEGMGLYKGDSRVVLSSMLGKEIKAGAGTVVYIDVTNFGGEAEGLFVNAANQTVRFNLATGEVTAIDGVAVNESLTQKIYNLGGKLMNGLKKGINIIRNSDGSSKKVVVK